MVTDVFFRENPKTITRQETVMSAVSEDTLDKPLRVSERERQTGRFTFLITGGGATIDP